MIGYCDSCGYKTALEKSDLGPGSREGNLCDVCRNTHAGNAFYFPNQYGDSAPILSTIAYCANMILDEIRKRR